MSFKGLLNDTCNIYSRTETIDEETGEQIFTNTLVAGNVLCALQNSSGSIDRQGRLIKSSNYDRIYLLPRTDITKQNTIIEVRAKKYRVSEVTDLGGRKRYLRIDLELIELDESTEESES